MIWSVEISDNDLIRRVHPLKDAEPVEPWKWGWVNGLIVFALMGIVLWGLR